MTDYKAPLRDLRFVLDEVFDANSFWSSFEETQDINMDLANAILEEGAKICENTLYPLFRVGDEEGCQFHEGEVKTPSGFPEAFKTYAEGGWVGLGGSAEYGGQGLPKSLTVPFEEMVYAANTSFCLYPTLSAGGTLAILRHANEALKNTYLPKMYTGEWAGTMCLTEPHSGTDLGILRSKAEPTADGNYEISGTKIFITGGEQDLTENIVHLVLARLPDAPAGPKGISLFIVPKFLVNADGSLGDKNAVSCGSIEKKMGIKGASTCVMNFDSAKGYLVGEPHRGLACMFTMMNYERLSIGIQGIGASELAYQLAADYAKDRLQGRAATGPQQAEKSADPIIVHADVRRMLLTIKAYTEGARAFAQYVARQLDTANYASDEEISDRASDLVALLTPVAKAFFTDKGLDNCVLGQQVFGGHGFIREWGAEQLVRDVRISQIYEGTNGIQALDLMGRKIAFSGGKLIEPFVEDIEDFVHSAEGNEKLAPMVEVLQSSLQQLQEATQWVLEHSKENPNEIGSASVPYLHLMGHVGYAYVWGLMAAKALEKNPELNDEFYQGKFHTAQFYFGRIMPVTCALLAEIKSGAELLYLHSEDAF